MDKIRWYELPEARQLASLGKKLSKAAQQRLQWILSADWQASRSGKRTIVP